MSNEKIVEQLCQIHEKYEVWQERMGREDSILYHRTMLENGVIQCASEGEHILGYIEVWRINSEQFGRLILGKPFCSMQENVLSGEVAWFANIFILPEHRRGSVIKDLRLKFFQKYENCPYYSGNKVKRTCAPFQIFTRSKLLKAREVIYG